MKNIFKIAMGVVAVSAVASFAGKYPFPQNMKHPYGTTVEYAVVDSVKNHFNAWKKTWYNPNNGWIYAPDGKESTVSEAIAYGMLISVYMDDQEMFEKVYSVWTSNAVSTGGGMNWRLGQGADGGSATDADEDAAVALVMASVQWSNSSYLQAAKTLINWMIEKDFDGTTMKPGSGWTSYLNPSYVMLGHYRLFEQVTGDTRWSNIRKKAAENLLNCQDSKTGLVGDWCDLGNSYKPAKSGQVTNDIGYYDDASRTPWRTAWAYYWYGDSDAKKFNEKVVNWLIPATHTASGVNSGYSYKNGTYEADESTERDFVSSSFSGGLGLATSSIEGSDAAAYLASTYKALIELRTCSDAKDCGKGSNAGEKYYPATLNVLYLLLMTGNMPNLYEIDKFAKFTPDPSKAPSVNEIGGQQMALGDQTVGVSGFWNWGAYHDKLGIGTVMVPDSGTSPLYRKSDGSILAEASMEIGPEPVWSEEADKAGTLKYPSAGIAMSFLADDKKGVDFTKLHIKSVRVTMKASGPIRMAILNTVTFENDAKFNAGDKSYKNAKAGSEPGIYVPISSDYVTTTYDLTPCDYGFLGRDKNCSNPDPDSLINILSWVDQDLAPTGDDILTSVAGLKWEVKDAKGGVGELSIKAVEFLDASGNVVDPSTITGVVVPEGIKSIASVASAAKVSVAGMNIAIAGVKAGSDIAVFNLQGKLVASSKALFGNATVTVPTKGIYLVRAGDKLTKVNVK